MRVKTQCPPGRLCPRTSPLFSRTLVCQFLSTSMADPFTLPWSRLQISSVRLALCALLSISPVVTLYYPTFTKVTFLPWCHLIFKRSYPESVLLPFEVPPCFGVQSGFQGDMFGFTLLSREHPEVLDLGSGELCPCLCDRAVSCHPLQSGDVLSCKTEPAACSTYSFLELLKSQMRGGGAAGTPHRGSLPAPWRRLEY